jgi:cysteinyl-tRNA synthetase
MLTALHGLHRSGKRRELRTALGLLGFSGDRNKIGRIAAAVGTASGTSNAQGAGSAVEVADIDKLIAGRAAARARKDFKESDRIRDELAAMGVVLKDGKDADGKPVTTWEIAR